MFYDLCATSHDQTHSDECPNSQAVVLDDDELPRHLLVACFSHPEQSGKSVNGIKLEIMTLFAFRVPAMGVPIFVLIEPSTR